MKVIICKIPSAGLGNQLFVIIKSIVFSQKNKTPLFFTNYHQFKIGPYLRNEKNKRKYLGTFIFEKNLFTDLYYRFILLLKKGQSLYDVPLQGDNYNSSYFIFTNLPHWSCYFKELQPFRNQIKEIIYNITNPSILKSLDYLYTPIIGVHIRLGDFKRLEKNIDFKEVGATRTPEDYFINTIQSIRKIHGSNLDVSIFSDGNEHELTNILKLPNTKLVTGNDDIVDLLLLSKSKIIITSAGSTFSYWSAFLSDAPVIMHPDHIHESIRDENTNSNFYEGALIEGKVAKLLKENIASIITH